MGKLEMIMYIFASWYDCLSPQHSLKENHSIQLVW